MPELTDCPYDAILIVSFGGPEGQDDVLPFLENVTRGRGIPPERLELVATHYRARGGISPINGHVRELIAALEAQLAASDIDLPVYWGNRNWHPMLADTLTQMADDGISNAIAFVTSAFSSYSGCRQYRENVAEACVVVGDAAPTVDKLRVFYDHPGFVEPMIDSVAAAVSELTGRIANAAAGAIGDHGVDAALVDDVVVMFTAHSIPNSMADGCDYVAQLTEAARLVAAGAGVDDWQLVYQSRSGPPQMPWLEPDVCDAITALPDSTSGVVVVPIGFISDHMEVIQDLDTDAAAAAAARNLAFGRAGTVGADPRFVAMIIDLIAERSGPNGSSAPRTALGALDIKPDICAIDCCVAPQRPRTGARP